MSLTCLCVTRTARSFSMRALPHDLRAGAVLDDAKGAVDPDEIGRAAAPARRAAARRLATPARAAAAARSPRRARGRAGGSPRSRIAGGCDGRPRAGRRSQRGIRRAAVARAPSAPRATRLIRPRPDGTAGVARIPAAASAEDATSRCAPRPRCGRNEPRGSRRRPRRRKQQRGRDLRPGRNLAERRPHGCPTRGVWRRRHDVSARDGSGGVHVASCARTPRARRAPRGTRAPATCASNAARSVGSPSS